MRVTIVSDDNKVHVDGMAIWPLDLTGLASDIHAIQWYDTFGDVEFRYDPVTQFKPQNQRITDLSPYQVFVDRYNAAKALLTSTAVSTAAIIHST